MKAKARSPQGTEAPHRKGPTGSTQRRVLFLLLLNGGCLSRRKIANLLDLDIKSYALTRALKSLACGEIALACGEIDKGRGRGPRTRLSKTKVVGVKLRHCGRLGELVELSTDNYPSLDGDTILELIRTKFRNHRGEFMECVDACMAKELPVRLKLEVAQDYRGKDEGPGPW